MTLPSSARRSRKYERFRMRERASRSESPSTGRISSGHSVRACGTPSLARRSPRTDWTKPRPRVFLYSFISPVSTQRLPVTIRNTSIGRRGPLRQIPRSRSRSAFRTIRRTQAITLAFRVQSAPFSMRNSPINRVGIAQWRVRQASHASTAEFITGWMSNKVR